MLATSPQLVSGNLGQFYEHSKSATLAGGDGWIVVRARMGRYCSIPGVAYGSDLPRFIDPEIDKAVFTERKSIVSNILQRPDKRSVGGLCYQPPSSMNATKLPTPFSLLCQLSISNPLLRQQQSPERWVLTINDREGRILARSLNYTEWVGKPMAQQGWDNHQRHPARSGWYLDKPQDSRRQSG